MEVARLLRRFSVLAAMLIVAGCSGSSSEPERTPDAAEDPTVEVGTLSFDLASYDATQDAGTLDVDVVRQNGSGGAISVNFTTKDGTALAGADYEAVSGTLSWADGDAAPKTVSIPISNVVPFSGEKKFSLDLSTPVGGAKLGQNSSATVSIKGLGTGGEPSTVALTASSFTVRAAETLNLPVTRSGDTSSAVSVTYATADGTARAGRDYVGASGTLEWAAGDTSKKQIPVVISSTAFTGNRTFSVTLSSPAGGAQLGSPTKASVSIAGSGTPASAPTVSLSANRTSVNSGESATLTWSSANATSCTASGAWTGTQSTSGSKSTGALTTTSTFTLTCTGSGGSASASRTVTVTGTTAQRPTVTLTANPTSVSSGGSSTLTWSSTNATSCTASGAWAGSQATSGSKSTGALTANSTFTLTCTGSGGSASVSRAVSVSAASSAPKVSLSANPTLVKSGESSTLTWSSTNATSCEASGAWSGNLATSGSRSTGALTKGATYSITCTGSGGTIATSTTVSIDSPQSATCTTSKESWVYHSGQFHWPFDYSWGGLAADYHDTTGEPLSGPYDIKVTTPIYGGWQPASENWSFDITGCKYLTFALKPTRANQIWHSAFLYVNDVPTGITFDVTNSKYGPDTPVVGQWNVYKIPLADYFPNGAVPATIYKFFIQDTSASGTNTWYIDNVGFTAN